MKIILNGTPEELKEFLNRYKSDERTLNSVDNIATNSNNETVVFTTKDYNALLNNLPRLPGIDKNNFQYDPIKDTGYFGRISSDKFIGYKKLCELVDFKTGKPMKEDKGWLVFYFKGEILYIPQHPIKYGISWDDINKSGLVYGNKVIGIDGNEYSISLMTGGKSDPLDITKYYDSNAEQEQELDLGNGSMWNELMYKVHQDIPGITDKNIVGSGGPQHGENWDSLTNEDLNIHWEKCDVGTATWTQETLISDIFTRMTRGQTRLAYLSKASSSCASTNYGWRPVLRYKAKS